MGRSWKKWIFDVKTKLLNRKLYNRHLTIEKVLASNDHLGILEINFNKRKTLVDYAVKHSTFYKNKYANVFKDSAEIRTEEDFTKLPILTREELGENFNSITADNVRKMIFTRCRPREVRGLLFQSCTTNGFP